MPYDPKSLEGRLLSEDEAVLGEITRWIALVLASPTFWFLRDEWADLHQEILARIIESLRLERFDASRDFRLYVQGIARKTALQSLAGQRSSPLGPARPGLLHSSAAEIDDRVDSLLIARRILDLASEDCREMIRLYFFEHRDYAEIAVHLGLPVGTVKSRLFRCMRRAHQALTEARRRRRS